MSVPVVVLSSLLLLPSTAADRMSECFTCMTNPNWSFYMSRIRGLKQLNASSLPTYAPMACIFDPMRVYSDRTAVSCPGLCMKWAVSTIQADGGVEVSMLRGCYDKLIDPSISPPPQDDRCYQSPTDYHHQVGVDYTFSCYCRGFVCNSHDARAYLWPSLLTLSFLLSSSPIHV